MFTKTINIIIGCFLAIALAVPVKAEETGKEIDSSNETEESGISSAEDAFFSVFQEIDPADIGEETNLAYDDVQPDAMAGIDAVGITAMENDSSLDGAALELRDSMKKHATYTTITFTSFNNYTDSINDLRQYLFGKACAHTTNPTEGDYLFKQTGYGGSNIPAPKASGGAYIYTIPFTFIYRMTEEQESAVTKECNRIIANLDVSKKTEYEKIWGIYQWFANNIKYDRSNIGSGTPYTAYGAAVEKKAVCQGYSLLFYRLCLMAGINCRYISGKAPTNEDHAWNIVKAYDKWYFVDSTWGTAWGVANSDKYFLKGQNSFTAEGYKINGIEQNGKDYRDMSFTRQYPISKTDYINCTSFTVSPTNLELDFNKTWNLSYSFKPSDCSVQSVSWSSSNPSIVSVDAGGKLTSYNTEGTATITGKNLDGKTATCKVTVKSLNVEPVGVTLFPDRYTLGIGDKVSIAADVLPENAKNKSVTWTSSNSAIATVSNGTVTAIAAGSAIITARTANGKEGTCRITVDSKGIVAVTSVTLNKSSLEMTVGEQFTLTATVAPSNATNKMVTYQSSDKKVATVNANNGMVNAIGAGTATITASTPNGKKATCKLTVKSKNVPVSSVSFDKTSLTMEVDELISLNATVSPANATNKSLTWASSNTKVATVTSSGKIRGISGGTASITATSNNGKTATCTVTVKEAGQEPSTGCTVTDGFCTVNNKRYWYENGKRQGVYGDPKNIKGYDYTLGWIERGREIYDLKTDGWYWLDAVYDGAAAFGKEVWMPYIYQNEDNCADDLKWIVAQESDAGLAELVYQSMVNKTGKWVRYDENGKMLKGWITISGTLAKMYPKQAGNTYYYDTRTGLMAKGSVKIDGKWRYFNEITGVLEK